MQSFSAKSQIEPLVELGREKGELIQFLESISRPGHRIDEVEDDANLIDAGLIDSFALIQIVLYLEERYGLNFRQAGIEVRELSSVAGILGTIEHAKS